MRMVVVASVLCFLFLCSSACSSIGVDSESSSDVVDNTKTSRQLQASAISSLILVDASTNQDILVLATDASNEIDVATLGPSLTIRAAISPGVLLTQIESVSFVWNDGELERRELVAPYSVSGDVDGNYNPFDPLQIVGDHTLNVTASYRDIDNGDRVDFLFVRLTVVDSTPFTDVEAYPADREGVVSGELRIWHKITIGFMGPISREIGTPSISNPFMDLRLDVNFTSEATSTSYIVPGYFAGDGNAANTGATAGIVWLVHFAPDQVGVWSWRARFLEGEGIAVASTAELAFEDVDQLFYFNGATGSFLVRSLEEDASIVLDDRDLRTKGRLQYVGEHHLQFAETKEWFLKVGADSPENLLAYEDFDNTPNIGNRRKTWALHQRDFRPNDPTWANGKGSELIGAINYLSAQGMNAVSFLTLNIDGDDQNVFPYISDDVEDRLRMDISKLAQWEVIFEHADRMGMFLHFKTQETENDQLLDGGELGNERKLYYRELIARFGHHLALNFNIGEENSNTDEQRKQFADYIRSIDPYDHPIVIHTFPNQKDQVYSPLLAYPSYDGASLQSSKANVFQDTLTWRTRSAQAGRKWVVANDEQGSASEGVVPDADDPTHDIVRKNVLWGNIMAGGAGVEYYFGYQFDCSDLTCENYRTRANLWEQSRFALEFFHNHSIPFWSMTNANDLVVNSVDIWCLAELDSGSHFVLYLPNGGSASIDLSGYPAGARYTVQWYDPRNGGNLQLGPIESVLGGSIRNLGNAFSTEDYVILLRQQSEEVNVSTLPSMQPSLNDTGKPPLSASSFPSSATTALPSRYPSELPSTITSVTSFPAEPMISLAPSLSLVNRTRDSPSSFPSDLPEGIGSPSPSLARSSNPTMNAITSSPTSSSSESPTQSSSESPTQASESTTAPSSKVWICISSVILATLFILDD